MPRCWRAAVNLAIAFSWVVLCWACGSQAPSSPTTAAPVPAPTDSRVTFTGRVKATNGGQALPNVAASFGPNITAVTDDAGMFTMRFQPGTTSRLKLEGDTIIARSVVASVDQTRTLDVDAIAQNGGFDLNFYREFVRDNLDSPGVLRTLRRWTDPPQIYLRTIDDKSNPVDSQTLALTESVIRETAPLFTGGRFGVATIERGTDTREGVSGWITVRWFSTRGLQYCGTANVAVSGGTIDFYPETGCRCAGGPAIGAALVRHEIGHAMGFFHTDSTDDVMFYQEVRCNSQVSARERYHAAIAYARPVGNSDPDTDPSGTVYVERLRVR